MLLGHSAPCCGATIINPWWKLGEIPCLFWVVWEALSRRFKFLLSRRKALPHVVLWTLHTVQMRVFHCRTQGSCFYLGIKRRSAQLYPNTSQISTSPVQDPSYNFPYFPGLFVSDMETRITRIAFAASTCSGLMWAWSAKTGMATVQHRGAVPGAGEFDWYWDVKVLPHCS